MADVHLGGWKQKPLQDLNFKSFQMAVNVCINEKLDFVLIAGDLFDTAFPSIEILKETFSEFKKLHDAGIPCFFIAGSHDYSVSGKTFLDVLEKTGFCKNIEDFEKTDEELILNPVIHNKIAMYGYPGKKTGLEVPELKKMKLKDSPEGMFKILMLHTTIDKALGDMGNLPIDSIEADTLPEVDYVALGHLHIDFRYKNILYPSPVFPNNFAELEKLGHGNFYIVNANLETKELQLNKIELKIKETERVTFEITNAVGATEKIISDLSSRDLSDKIVLMRVKGILNDSKVSNIDFKKIENFVMERGAYFILRNTHDLKVKEEEIEFEVKEENIEDETMKIYLEKNPTRFQDFIPLLVNSLAVEKQEGETSDEFSRRVFDDSRKILGI